MSADQSSELTDQASAPSADVPPSPVGAAWHFWLSLLSALAFFAFSQGIRDHFMLLHDALLKIVGRFL